MYQVETIVSNDKKAEMSRNLGLSTLLIVISLVSYIGWPNSAATATVEEQASQTPVATEMPMDHSAHNPVDREVVTATQPITWATVSGTPEQPNEGIDQEEPSAHDMTEMVGGHNMGPVSREGVPTATEKSGGQRLEFREVDGVKEFNLAAERVLWPIMEGVTVTAWTYNGMLPGPMIRVIEGLRLRVWQTQFSSFPDMSPYPNCLIRESRSRFFLSNLLINWLNEALRKPASGLLKHAARERDREEIHSTQSTNSIFGALMRGTSLSKQGIKTRK